MSDDARWRVVSADDVTGVLRRMVGDGSDVCSASQTTVCR